MFTQEQQKRFWKNVDIRGPSECWNWKSSLDRYGYGKVKIGGRVYISHRVAFAIAGDGKMPSGLCVCHACDNPACCNPAHLHTGTHRDNMADMDSRGRRFRGKAQAAKLNYSIAEEMRVMFSAGEPKKAIARRFGCSPRMVRDIVNMILWKKPHLPSGRKGR